MWELIKIKWRTKSQYVDIQTGEIITESEYKRNYIKIKTTKNTHINEKYGIREFTHECERNRQTKLEL